MFRSQPFFYNIYFIYNIPHMQGKCKPQTGKKCHLGKKGDGAEPLRHLLDMKTAAYGVFSRGNFSKTGVKSLLPEEGFTRSLGPLMAMPTS